jgi:hypothetical protein
MPIKIHDGQTAIARYAGCKNKNYIKSKEGKL